MLDPQFFATAKTNGWRPGQTVYYHNERYGSDEENNGPSAFLMSRPKENGKGREHAVVITTDDAIHLRFLTNKDGEVDWWSNRDYQERLAKIAVGDVSYGFRHLLDLPKGSTLWTQLVKVSASGMSRVINVMTFECQKDEPHTIQRSMVRVLELSGCAKDADQERKWGGDYRVGGCGMGMGFHLVYELGHLVHGDGYYFTQRWV